MQKLNLDETAVTLLDHQVGTNTQAARTPLELLQRIVIILATFAAVSGLATMRREYADHRDPDLAPFIRRKSFAVSETQTRKIWIDKAVPQRIVDNRAAMGGFLRFGSYALTVGQQEAESGSVFTRSRRNLRRDLLKHLSALKQRRPVLSGVCEFIYRKGFGRNESPV